VRQVVGAVRKLVARRTNSVAYDRDQQPVFLADSQWTANTVQQSSPAIVLRAWNETQQPAY
jgi:peptide subunit release factor RF-3